MGDIEVLRNLGLMVVAAAFAVLLLRCTRTPTIVLYILAGLFIGPGIGWVAPGMAQGAGEAAHHGALEVIAEIGIALLLFLVGLELSLDRIRDVGKVAVLAGLGQVVFTALGGFLISLLLTFTVVESIFLAVALTFSSTVVVVKLLDQKQELHTLYGRISVGIFLVQDLVVIVALTFVAGLGPAGAEAGGVAVGAMLGSLALAFGGMGVLLVFALLAARYLLPRPVGWAGGSPPVLFLGALAWCFLFVVAAEKLGLSMEIGAFLAGLSLAQIAGSEDLRRRVHPLMNFFVMIFFVSLGVQMELGAAVSQWFSALVLSFFVLVGSPLIFMPVIRACGYGARTSFLTSVTLAQISEFSFIFTALGVSAGLIDSAILSLVAVVGLVTIGLSSFMILYNHALYDWCRRTGLLRRLRLAGEGGIEAPEGGEGHRLSGHVIVVGMNALGRRIVEAIHREGEHVVAVDTDPAKLEGLPGPHVRGSIDLLAVQEEVNLGAAKLVVSALQIEETNNLLAYHCRARGVVSAIHAFDESVFDELRRLGVGYLIDTTQQGAVEAATRAYGERGEVGP